MKLDSIRQNVFPYDWFFCCCKTKLFFGIIIYSLMDACFESDPNWRLQVIYSIDIFVWFLFRRKFMLCFTENCAKYKMNFNWYQAIVWSNDNVLEKLNQNISEIAVSSIGNQSFDMGKCTFYMMDIFPHACFLSEHIFFLWNIV